MNSLLFKNMRKPSLIFAKSKRHDAD